MKEATLADCSGRAVGSGLTEDDEVHASMNIAVSDLNSVACRVTNSVHKVCEQITSACGMERVRWAGELFQAL